VALVECVPNFSEGRRTDIIEAITTAISSAEIHLLDRSSDPDHNRTVVTFAGEPEAVYEAAYRGIETASRLIDLRQHQGVHPRIGAADVVPLRDISLSECAVLARRLGQRVADRLELPVYLYEEAALQPERKNLAYVRRDPYELLITTIQTQPDRKPDFGPMRLSSAGAVAIGARAPLIAFNVYLNTAKVEIAREIARTVRASGGGLPYLKAIGVSVKGQAQVSMNVIDFRQTSLPTILETVRAEAARHGASITHTELVGLIPQSALFDAALAYLQLPPATREQILEYRVGAATGDYRELPFE
jgi:glutamate formiminotransferase